MISVSETYRPTCIFQIHIMCRILVSVTWFGVLLSLVPTSYAFDVFSVQSPLGRYKFRTVADASHTCKQYNARLATFAEVEKEQEKGFDDCTCGWTSDGKVRHIVVELDGVVTRRHKSFHRTI